MIVGAIVAGGAARADRPRAIGADCTVKRKKLWGRVEVVAAYADLDVQIVDAYGDLRMQRVDAYADACGKRQIVAAHGDLKVRVVARGDLKVQLVDADPGVR